MDRLSQGNVRRVCALCNPQPRDVLHYVDVVTVWMREPLSERRLNWLREQCGGHVDRRLNGEIIQRTDRSYQITFPDSSFRQRLQLHQPKQAVLYWLAQLNDVRLSYVELSQDWVMANEDDRKAAYEFACRHLIKRHHGAQRISFMGRTRYSGPRRAPNNIVVYDDKPSKLTGEIDVLHFDWRIRGTAALRRAGIASVNDLTGLNHIAFWRQRQLFFEIDLTRLGRMSNNRAFGINRRRPWIEKYRPGLAVDMDQRAGTIIAHAYGQTDFGFSVQNIIDELRGYLNVATCLRPIVLDQPLPANSAHIL